jgi:hypothetical protein
MNKVLIVILCLLLVSVVLFTWWYKKGIMLPGLYKMNVGDSYSYYKELTGFELTNIIDNFKDKEYAAKIKNIIPISTYTKIFGQVFLFTKPTDNEVKDLCSQFNTKLMSAINEKIILSNFIFIKDSDHYVFMSDTEQLVKCNWNRVTKTLNIDVPFKVSLKYINNPCN